MAWDVRIKLTQECNLSDLLAEHLRYAGVAKLDKEGYLTVYEPKAVSGKAWAEMNAQRIRSFGVDARAVKRS